MSIDVIGYLETANVDIKYEGENVGNNDVAICCPFCDDPSYHLTIHRSKGYLNCWRCEFEDYKANNKNRWKPSFKALIKEIEGCSWKKAKAIWEDIGGESSGYSGSEDNIAKAETCTLPTEALTFDNPGKFWGERDFAFSYLKQRGFTKWHIEKYNLHFCPSGRHQHRIIIPIYKNGELVNWLGRRYIDNIKARYLNCKIEDCSLRLADTLYGEDNWSGDVLRIVEGAFDKIRIGDSALALNRSQFSKKQRSIITSISKKANYVSLLLDPEAEHRAISIAEEISTAVHKIKIVSLPTGTDPASLSFDQIIYAEKQTSFFIF